MLKRLRDGGLCAAAEVPIADAAYPAPFAAGLEFNPPVHGTWNIVHMGMLVPEALQIYVCAPNCMRGVILTAAEMGLENRFAQVILRQEDLVEGTVEEITIEGVSRVLEQRDPLPPAVLLFTVCLHHFLGSDLDYIYTELQSRFPTVDFLRSYMDPICQKKGLTPEQKLRKSMFDGIPRQPVRPGTVAILGDDFRRTEQDDLIRLLRANGLTPLQLHDCTDYAAYRALGSAEKIIAGYPTSAYGTKLLAERLGRPYLYLPASFSYEQEERGLRDAAGFLGVSAPTDIQARIAECESLAETLRLTIGDTPVVIDAAVHPCPLGLARYLIEHGIRVIAVHLDAVSPAEKDDFEALRTLAPELLLRAIIRPEMRVLPRGAAEKILAVGQKAAWFYNTPYVVNQVQGAGHYGFEGIAHMLRAMTEAALEEKDTRDIVPRKGWGCESCI